LIFSSFFGFSAGIYVPMLIAQKYRSNKPFDDYHIPANILLVALIMLLCAVLSGTRRLWLGLGFSAGAAVSLLIMGLGALVFTYMHFV